MWPGSAGRCCGSSPSGAARSKPISMSGPDQRPGRPGRHLRHPPNQGHHHPDRGPWSRAGGPVPRGSASTRPPSTASVSHGPTCPGSRRHGTALHPPGRPDRADRAPVHVQPARRDPGHLRRAARRSGHRRDHRHRRAVPALPAGRPLSARRVEPEQIRRADGARRRPGWTTTATPPWRCWPPNAPWSRAPSDRRSDGVGIAAGSRWSGPSGTVRP